MSADTAADLIARWKVARREHHSAIQSAGDDLATALEAAEAERDRQAEALAAVDRIEDVLADYFANRDLPMVIREAVDAFEIARAAIAGSDQ